MRDETDVDGGGPLTLADIMSVDVDTVSADATVREVAELLSGEGVSGVPVVSNSRVLGVISASDIVDLVALSPRPARPGAGPSVTTRRTHPSGQADAPGTFYTDWSLLDVTVLDEAFETEGAARDPLSEFTVRDLMTSNVRALSPDTDVHAAADYMMELGVHRILVMTGDQLDGIVTTLDFLRAVAERRL